MSGLEPSVEVAPQQEAGLDESGLYRIIEQHRDAALLQFAHASGLFDLLLAPKSTAELVAVLGWVPRKTTILLNGLTALGLTTRHADRYQATPVARSLLAKSSDHYIGSYVEVIRRQWDVWTKLPEIMASDTHVPGQQRLGGDGGDHSFTELFQDAMAQVCDADVTALVTFPPWHPQDHVLDLGGGHGLYLARLATQNPSITGEVWDLPAAEARARETFERHGVAERLTFRTCDLGLLDAVRKPCANVVMINHCLHHFTPESAERLLRNAVGLLKTGGRIIVIDQDLDGSGDTPSDSALFSFYLMVNNATGQLHPIPWLRRILENEGLRVTHTRCGWDEEDVLLLGEGL